MPWRETSPMDNASLRSGYETGLVTMTELAAQYGISRKTGYYWVDRYAAKCARFGDRSRRPITVRRPRIRVIELWSGCRRRHPALGRQEAPDGRRADTGVVEWPAPSTVNAHLKARGLVRLAGSRPPVPSCRAPRRSGKRMNLDDRFKRRVSDRGCRYAIR